MADWSTISALATAGGTLVLGVATFASVRSANRAARVAERSFQIGLRPVLVQSRTDDPPMRVTFWDRYWLKLEGGKAAIEVANGNIYLAMMLRNVGNGIGIIEAWAVSPRGEEPSPEEMMDAGRFRNQTRDLWIPPNDVAFWQGALRESTEPIHASVLQGIEAGDLLIDLRYRDHEGGQRTVSRFSVVRRDLDGDGTNDGWWPAMGNIRNIE